jgi:hypothetical protein
MALSCRGVWGSNGNTNGNCNTNGNGNWYGADAVSEAKELAVRSDGRLRAALKEAPAVYSEFFYNCREAGVMAEPSSLRSSVNANIDKFTDITYLAKVMDASLEEPLVLLDDIVASSNIDMNELNEAAREAAMDSMRSSDPVNVPVYCDGKWNWNLFMIKKDRIEWSILDNNGDLNVKGSADPNDIILPALDEGARGVLKDYVSVLNQRDSMMGFAFHTMDSLNYEDDMTNVYYGSLSVAIIDVMWRSSMLNHILGTGIGADGMKEAIIFYDMDRLDAPTIGAFV